MFGVIAATLEAFVLFVLINFTRIWSLVFSDISLSEFWRNVMSSPAVQGLGLGYGITVLMAIFFSIADRSCGYTYLRFDRDFVVPFHVIVVVTIGYMKFS